MKKVAEKTILVGSGKGGVGKSTISVNMAVALGQMGYRVGLLDADFYGPSIPIMMGLRNLSPRTNTNGLVIPITKFSIHVISLGFFIEEKRCVLWRGPMLHKMLEKMVVGVAWPELDFLIIDLPPGTGDVPLSLTKLIAVTGGIIVTTPQEVAILDARKAIHAFEELHIPLLGIVENMAGLKLDSHSEMVYPFGCSKGKEFASELGVPLLESLPLFPSICEGGDLGIPSALNSSTFLNLAGKLRSF